MFNLVNTTDEFRNETHPLNLLNATVGMLSAKITTLLEEKVLEP